MANEDSRGIDADNPIVLPEQDLYGVSAFALTLASKLCANPNRDGSVIGIHGPWGSGKSSAVNLIKHHIRKGDLPGADDVVVVDFNPWWFSDSDSLVRSFFSEVGAALSKSVGEKAKGAVRSLGRRLGRNSDLLGGLTDIFSLGLAGDAVRSVANAASQALDPELTVVEEHQNLAEVMRAQSKHFVVVVDDIDRLDIDDALLLFKLVKSAGRLPNITYVMVFDRALVVRHVSKKFPSEGPQYLEKILQASFEVPQATDGELQNILLGKLFELVGQPTETDIVEFMNIFYDVVAPLVKLPRDVIRLINGLTISWHAVADDVYAADFVGLEALRLLNSSVFEQIWTNRAAIVGVEAEGRYRPAPTAEQYDALLLPGRETEERKADRRALSRLFPRLKGIWGNYHYSSHSLAEWRRLRRLCSPEHFDTYFRFEASPSAIAASDFRKLMAATANADAFAALLVGASQTSQRVRGTLAAIYLDELNVHANDIPVENLKEMVRGLFAVADTVDVEADSQGFSSLNNNNRVHWLLSRALLDRTTTKERNAIVINAAPTAEIYWLSDFHRRCAGFFDEARKAKHDFPEIVDRQTFDRLTKLLLRRLRAFFRSKVVPSNSKLITLLYRWSDLEGDGGLAKVKRWTARHSKSPEGLEALVSAMIGRGWTQSGDDRVAIRSGSVSARTLSDLFERPQFVARVRARADGDGDNETVFSRFLTLLDEADRNPHR